MKNLLTISLMLFFSILLKAQNIQQIKSDHNNYLWGEGSGNTLKKADNNALDMLISQISVEVESNFSFLKDEKSEGKDYSYSETVKSVISTYSTASLNNTERIVISNEPDAKVFRYIKRSEINKIFQARKDKILGFVKNANTSLQDNYVGDAIRYYYWAYTLLRSHPQASSIKAVTSEGTEQLLSTWLPFQLQNIFNNIEVKIVKVENYQNYSQAILSFWYKSKPMQNFEYSYWDGLDWSNIVSCKNGLGFADFAHTNENINEVSIKAEYTYEAEAKSIDNELNDVFNKIDDVIFRNSYLKANKASSEIVQADDKPEYNLKVELKTVDSYQEIIDKFCIAIAKDDYTSVANLFTDQGFRIYKQLIGFGKAKVLRKDDLRYLGFGDRVICRGLSMSFAFANNTRSFVEDVVLSFDKNNKICDITLGLEQNAINDILSQDKWSESVRINLIDFMEHYKTAFALKQLDYINSIFSDDALIITGWVLKTKPNADMQYKNNEIVKYNHYTKEQYLKRLQHSFQSNEFINLKFNDNNIRKSGKGGEVYGIQIQQDYFSSSYGDSGYLFLLIDMNDTSQPSIHVRTWQPEKNPDGSIYGVENF